MKNKKLLDDEYIQEVFEYYLTNDSYLEGALYGLKKYERRSFISCILSYEYKNLVENNNLKIDEKYNAILPSNLITILEYDKKNFNGTILRNFINDLEFELEHIEMELYDDPADFEGGDYYNEDSECDEDYTVEDWVEDQVSNIKDFLYALKAF
ncbi:hypothetical protein [Campylobacter insulaenigrae]|uniref:hypothetical protein n=1 Tax=Campylobacter insulaenigrae TaxID=260714 RepID=UPI00215274CB|nr:hypothetical protein [Campylobacter insulaenigrae]MCR6571533.1 hypothetical protein [Campylobacter insulaenigrae]MCR6574659.1 hypothetical protein [Campylobacter insulaenigrae]MCR6577747.1 hypothetical protein [Campylobacter insulaenigrae]MCR6583870.1 hypothetical protein [Campylobacter insulaenigrae]MCR6585398.1 hypothetical protein [Campylobacter insulaenigrae]